MIDVGKRIRLVRDGMGTLPAGMTGVVTVWEDPGEWGRRAYVRWDDGQELPLFLDEGDEIELIA